MTKWTRLFLMPLLHLLTLSVSYLAFLFICAYSVCVRPCMRACKCVTVIDCYWKKITCALQTGQAARLTIFTGNLQLLVRCCQAGKCSSFIFSSISSQLVVVPPVSLVRSPGGSLFVNCLKNINRPATLQGNLSWAVCIPKLILLVTAWQYWSHFNYQDGACVIHLESEVQHFDRSKNR